MERDRAFVPHRLSTVVGQMPLLDREAHSHC
jgi:hypothetical protein